MADNGGAQGIPALSVFDQLKWSTNGSQVNTSNSASNTPSKNNIRLEVGKGSYIAVPTSDSSADKTGSSTSDSLESEKSITALSQAQIEPNETVVLLEGSNDANLVFSTNQLTGNNVVNCVSDCANPVDSDFGSFSTPSSPSAGKSERVMQVLCPASDKVGTSPAYLNTAYLSHASSFPLLSSLLPQQSSQPTTRVLSSSDISTITPSSLPPTLSLSLSTPPSPTISIPSSSPSVITQSNLNFNPSVQNKNKKFESNELLKNSGRCKAPATSSSTHSANALVKPKSATNICAPPPIVLTTNSRSKCPNKKSNQKMKNQNVGGGSTVFGKSTKPSADSNRKRQQSTITDDTNDQQDTSDERNKKRCSDRYDSSESSDSGVATSLSCTDSSTTSSDASDPGSPYSPSLIGDELQHKSNMPPQTILSTANGNTTKSPTTNSSGVVQNAVKGCKQQKQNQSQNKSVHLQQQLQKQGKSQIPPPLQKVSQHVWPWSSVGGTVGGGRNFGDIVQNPKNFTSVTNKNNKRHSQGSLTTTDSNTKKSRANTTSLDNSNINGNSLQQQSVAASSKRLKAAALEDSQTKITGYFKSQIKPQSHQSCVKKENTAHVLPSSSCMATLTPSITVTAVVSSVSSSVAPNCITSTVSSGSSLNKYFNMLSTQIREDQERASKANVSSLPPALKKIERSKPPKIAQVAPNLRKTTAAPPHSNPLVEKSPKKHVPIAPRGMDMKKKQETTSVMKTPNSATPQSQPQPQQPTVLLTAIRIPQASQPPQLVPTSSQQQVSVSNVNVSKSPGNGGTTTAAVAVSKISTGPSLYQIPMMPNLVQFPNLIAANVSHLTTARNNHSHPTTTAQYFLNGTVFKLQQFTTPSAGSSPPAFSIDNGNQSLNTTTVGATTANVDQHTANNKTNTAITATNFQEILSNQFQTQQQQQQQQHQQQQHSVGTHNRLHHSQPIFMATTTGLLLNAASLPAVLGSNKQTVAIQPQQLPALQPIQNTNTVMPGLSSIFSPHHEVAAAQQLQQLKAEQVVLDTQSTLPQGHVPPLSVSPSTFNKLAIVKASTGFTPSVHQVSSTQPPPLVTISSGTQNVITNCKVNGANKSSPSTKSYQKKDDHKTKNSNDTTKKILPELSVPLTISPIITPIPPKSPPALAYPSLYTASSIDIKPDRTEDLFDLLKNAHNEKTLVLAKPQDQLETIKDESLEANISDHTPSSPSHSSDSASNTITSEQSGKLDDQLSLSLNTSLEASPASTSSISLLNDVKNEELDTTTASSPTIDITLAESDTLPKSAISPILSQPKTIRFPAKHESGHRFGPKGIRRHDGVCYWDKCNKKHESNTKLLDHMQSHHVNTQTGPFACLWMGCKVYGRESCSRRWLERHVLFHIGTKPFKCIVDGCGLRFGSQLALQKHVNGHFTATENKDNTNKRASDPPVPKLLRKNGKKLRYRRQPFSARMFDFFDTGIMEGLQHRLRQISNLTDGKNNITFRGQIIMRRTNLKGIVECFVQWTPPEIISNEWLPDTGKPFIKTLAINRMRSSEKTNVETLLKSAYRQPYSPNLFQSFPTLSRATAQSLSTSSRRQSTSTIDDSTDEMSRSSGFGSPSLDSVSNLPVQYNHMELRKKQSRKPPKRIQPS